MEDSGSHTNAVELTFKRPKRFDETYEDFKKRKLSLKKKKKKGSNWIVDDEDDDGKSDTASPLNDEINQGIAFKIVRNPMTPEPVEEIEDEFGEDTFYSIKSLPFEILWTIEKTIEDSFSRGILLGYPLMNVRIKLTDAKYSIRRSNPMIFQMATVNLIKELMNEADAQLLEPVMDIEISSPNPMVQTLLNDIISRRGKVGDILQEGSRFNKNDEGQRSLIHAVVPLEATIGYATYLRTLTKVLFF